MNETFIVAADGYKLSALFDKPVGRSIGTIVISSATGVKKEFYVNFARFLVDKGYAVLLYDYRGIGGSAPLDIKLSDAYMHEWGIKDMNAVMDYLVNKKGLTEIIWIGHSVGAQLIGFVDNHRHIKRVIAINSALGYWGYLPFPKNFIIWILWFLIGPLLVKIYGYGNMKKIGWGENLPRNALLEWRKWCLNRNYFESLVIEKLGMEKFYHFMIPITSVYTSDDFIANDRTVPLMLDFFPNAPREILKLPVRKYTREKVEHTGIFRKKFKDTLWVYLLDVIEVPSSRYRISVSAGMFDEVDRQFR